MITTTVSRDRSGTTVSAPSRGGGSASPRIETIIAQIDTDNDDGTYDATEQQNADGTFSDRSATTGMVFDSGTNGNLYELNGLRGTPVGTFVVVHRIANTSGGPIWYFDGQQVAYGVDASGAWVKITANTSSPYTWSQLDADATTTTNPAVNGTSNLHEVNGYDGYLKDKIVWAKFDGTAYRFEFKHHAFLAKITSGTTSYAWTEMQDNGSTATTRTGSGALEVNGREGIPPNSIVTMFQDAGSSLFRFEFHGANSGTVDALLYSSQLAAHADTWERDNQGATRGEKDQFMTRLYADTSTGEISEYTRRQICDANGHRDEVDAETGRVVFVGTPSTDTYEFVDCATGLTTVARFDVSDLPTDDYCWVHDGSSFVKSYNDGISAGAATSPVPCVVLMNSRPTQCSGVNYAAFGDDFDDSSFDTCRWSKTETGAGSVSESTSLSLATTSTGVASEATISTDLDLSGDFSLEFAYSSLSYSLASSGYTMQLQLRLTIGGTLFETGMDDQTGGAGTIGGYVYDGTSSTYFQATVSTSGVFKVHRGDRCCACFGLLEDSPEIKL